MSPRELTSEHLGKRVRVVSIMRTVEGYLTSLTQQCALVQTGPDSRRASQIMTEVEVGGITLTAFSDDSVEVLA